MQALTTVTYANQYFSTKPKCEWGELSEEDKQTQLYEATRRIYAVQGFKYTPEVIELLSAVPDDLQQACCEIALGLLNYGDDNVHVENQKLGIKSISFGKDSASYGDNMSSLGLNNAVFSEYAQSILNKYLLKGVPYV